MSRFSNRIDQRFSYTNASDSSRPGYLKAKFDKERRRLAEIAEREAKPKAIVRAIKEKKA